MKKILYYFPYLTKLQIIKLEELFMLYKEWNKKINLISRKDINFFYEHHVLHSLAIGKIIQFTPETKILDVGTGGGFPGIPLSILFPTSNFILVDSIQKKIKAVNNICKILKLKNVTTKTSRVEKLNGRFHFIVSRATTNMKQFVSWTLNLFDHKSFNKIPNGILYLKGGDLSKEIKINSKFRIYKISDFFYENFFNTKKIVYLKSTYMKYL